MAGIRLSLARVRREMLLHVVRLEWKALKAGHWQWNNLKSAVRFLWPFVRGPKRRKGLPG